MGLGWWSNMENSKAMLDPMIPVVLLTVDKDFGILLNLMLDDGLFILENVLNQPQTYFHNQQ